MDARRPLKVAIIGTGLAGLTAAHLLEKEASQRGVELDVHLFEKVSLNPSLSPILRRTGLEE